MAKFLIPLYLWQIRAAKILSQIFLFFLVGLFSESTLSQEANSKSEIFGLQKQWVEALKNRRNIAFVYDRTSGLMRNDSLYIGISEIESVLKDMNREDGLVQYDTLSHFQLYPGQIFVHGVYSTEKGIKLSSVIGWRRDGKWIKAFEVIAQRAVINEKSEKEIGLLRASWELYSNQHRPDLIARNVFSDNGRYFYKGLEYRGMDIADAYGYMRDKSYSIDLTPQKVIQVNDHLIYEIGIYDTGGKGLYFLLWARKGEQWKLLLDFNF